MILVLDLNGRIAECVPVFSSFSCYGIVSCSEDGALIFFDLMSQEQRVGSVPLPDACPLDEAVEQNCSKRKSDVCVLSADVSFEERSVVAVGLSLSEVVYFFNMVSFRFHSGSLQVCFPITTVEAMNRDLTFSMIFFSFGWSFFSLYR